MQIRWLPLRRGTVHSRGRPIERTVCHCRDCQKFTGSAFAVLVRPTREALTIEGTFKTFSSIGRAVIRSSGTSARNAAHRSPTSQGRGPA